MFHTVKYKIKLQTNVEKELKQHIEHQREVRSACKKDQLCIRQFDMID
jgi:hypothetical protein